MSCFSSLDETALLDLKNQNGITVLFKHSTRCPISTTALNRVKSYCSKSDKHFNSYIVNVIEERAISNQIADEFAVRHESPQLIILKDGMVRYHQSHLGITESDLISQIDQA